MSTLNVVRYTALVSGLFYGVIHRRSLQKEVDLDKVKAAEHQRESWIQQAKKEYAKKSSGESASPLQKLTGIGGGLITDPEDPKFDLDKLVTQYEAQGKL
ncbi:MAG: hypothetical protein CYPHOPRED_003527 [Cyphobasidiales sp. Tagirdzhanova-0007]|nr:MAG: hypothetical protein CYPHOPRED_003527 [Cyphobasidiales sp. Tagirdzhanova-0007]